MEEEILEEDNKIEVGEETEFLDTEDFITELSQRANFTKADTRSFLKNMQEIFEDAITENVEIRIRGFLTLKVKKIKGFKGINPRQTKITGKKIFVDYPESRKVVISAGINLRDILRQPEKKKINSKANKILIEKIRSEREGEEILN